MKRLSLAASPKTSTLFLPTAHKAAASDRQRCAQALLTHQACTFLCIAKKALTR